MRTQYPPLILEIHSYKQQIQKEVRIVTALRKTNKWDAKTKNRKKKFISKRKQFKYRNVNIIGKKITSLTELHAHFY